MSEKLYGISEIVNSTGFPKHIVSYYIDRWSIQATARLSGRRIFSEATVQKLKEMLEITMKAKSFKTKTNNLEELYITKSCLTTQTKNYM